MTFDYQNRCVTSIEISNVQPESVDVPRQTRLPPDFSFGMEKHVGKVKLFFSSLISQLSDYI